MQKRLQCWLTSTFSHLWIYNRPHQLIPVNVFGKKAGLSFSRFFATLALMGVLLPVSNVGRSSEERRARWQVESNLSPVNLPVNLDVFRCCCWINQVHHTIAAIRSDERTCDSSWARWTHEGISIEFRRLSIRSWLRYHWLHATIPVRRL